MPISKKLRQRAQLLSGVLLYAALIQAQTVQPAPERVAHYAGLSGLDHAVFRGAGDTHIYYQNFFSGPNNGSGGGYWSTPIDLFSLITPIPANAAGPPFALIFNPDGGAAGPAFDGIVYLGQDGDIHLLSQVAGGNWTHTDLTAATQANGGASSAQGNPMAFVASLGAYGSTGAGRPTEVVYWGTDENIWSLDYFPAAGWVSSTSRTTQVTAGSANSNPWGLTATGGTSNLIFFADSAGNIQEILNAQGLNSIADLGSVSAAPPSEGNPQAFDTQRTSNLVYATNTANLGQLYSAGGNTWVANDFSTIPLQADPFGYARTDGGTAVLYWGTGADRDIHEYLLPAGTADSGTWTARDISAIAGAPAGGGEPIGYQRADGQINGVLYVGTDNHIHELYLPQPASAAGWKTYDLTELAPPITITPTTLPSGSEGTQYFAQLTASGGNAPYTFVVLGTPSPSGLLTGLSLSASGLLSGIPESFGTGTFTVWATDANGLTGPTTLLLTLSTPGITIAPATIPPGTIGFYYSLQFNQTGGTGTITYRMTSGTIPGLTLSPSGVLSGTPTQMGTFAFTVQVGALFGTMGTLTTSITIQPANGGITVTNTPTQGTVGVLYSFQFTASGGNGNYIWSCSCATLQSGLTVSSTGLLSGMPSSAGVSLFTVQVNDMNTATGSLATSVTIVAPGSPSLAIVASHTGNFQQGQQNATFTIAVSNNGTAALTFAEVLVRDALPTGLSYVASAGAGWNCGNNGNVLSCAQFGGLAAGGAFSTIIVAVNVAANAPVSIVNIAGVSGGGAANSASSSDTITIAPASQQASIIGNIDTPKNDSINLAGSLGVTGWALGLNGISSVGIYRAPVTGEAPLANGLVFIGNATIVPGARPDVVADYPSYPDRLSAGWGFQILTNTLPGTGGLARGNGSYELHAIATDLKGNTLDLGSVAISVNNSASILPFGAIDTPAQGATISGSSYVVFGWALTPSPNVIPVNGSTIRVLIDTPCLSAVVPVCDPLDVPPTAYSYSRCDVDADFPSLANSGSTSCAENGTHPGPAGYYKLDTTKLANGLHSLAWKVVDGDGNVQGIGSRFFIVAN